MFRGWTPGIGVPSPKIANSKKSFNIISTKNKQPKSGEKWAGGG